MELTDKELNLIRQWFDAVEDVLPEYLGKADVKLGQRIQRHLGFRVRGSTAAYRKAHANRRFSTPVSV